MATQDFSTNVGVGPTPEFSQIEFPAIYNDSLRIRTGLKIIQGALDSYTGIIGDATSYWSQQKTVADWHRIHNHTRTYCMALEDIPIGNFVNFVSSGGRTKARKSNGALGYKARGWCTADVAAGEYGQFILEGTCFLIGGLTTDTTYYLSNTPGYISPGPGTTSQKIGFALDTNVLIVRPDL